LHRKPRPCPVHLSVIIMNIGSLLQRLKEDTRQRIIAAGRAELMRGCFTAASMRAIAAAAGVSVGNLYRYFPGKEALFQAVVRPAYSSLLSLVRADARLDRKAMKDFRSVQPVADLLLSACRAYRTEVLVLTDRSAGTRYENTKNVLVRHIERRLSAGLHSGRAAGGAAEDAFILHVMAATFVEGFLMVLRRGADPRFMDRALRRLLALFFEDIATRMAPEPPRGRKK
jgi:AcrR family transcriptional regulator